MREHALAWLLRQQEEDACERDAEQTADRGEQENQCKRAQGFLLVVRTARNASTRVNPRTGYEGFAATRVPTTARRSRSTPPCGRSVRRDDMSRSALDLRLYTVRRRSPA